MSRRSERLGRVVGRHKVTVWDADHEVKARRVAENAFRDDLLDLFMASILESGVGDASLTINDVNAAGETVKYLSSGGSDANELYNDTSDGVALDSRLRWGSDGTAATTGDDSLGTLEDAFQPDESTAVDLVAKTATLSGANTYVGTDTTLRETGLSTIIKDVNGNSHNFLLSRVVQGDVVVADGDGVGIEVTFDWSAVT